MISLKKSKEELDEENGVTPSSDPYGWGTCINLDDDQVKALGVQSLPIGTRVKVTAFAVVKGLSMRQEKDEKEAVYMDLQLTDMEVSKASTVSDDSVSAMYPSSQG